MPLVVIFALSDGQLSYYEAYNKASGQAKLHEIFDQVIINQKDVLHFESYFHTRSMKQMLATVNRN